MHKSLDWLNAVSGRVIRIKRKYIKEQALTIRMKKDYLVKYNSKRVIQEDDNSRVMMAADIKKIKGMGYTRTGKPKNG